MPFLRPELLRTLCVTPTSVRFPDVAVALEALSFYPSLTSLM